MLPLKISTVLPIEISEVLQSKILNKIFPEKFVRQYETRKEPATKEKMTYIYSLFYQKLLFFSNIFQFYSFYSLFWQNITNYMEHFSFVEGSLHVT